jgi:hypothetical protein
MGLGCWADTTSNATANTATAISVVVIRASAQSIQDTPTDVTLTDRPYPGCGRAAQP